MDQTITCINCPVGCRMTVTLDDDGQFLSAAGYSCPRGLRYARQECTQPRRMITAVLPVEGSATPLSVKTAQPIPKARISDIMDALSRIRLKVPVHAGDVVLADVLHTGVDVIATRSLGEA